MVRLLRQPTLRAATQATVFQRLFALMAMVVMVSLVLFWPNIRDHAGQALAQTQDNSYQPFNCGQSNSSSGQARRENLPLNNDSGGTANGHAYPCISGVQWRLVVGNTQASLADTNGIIGEIQGAYSTQWANGDGTCASATFCFAGTGAVNGLVQVSIKGLGFCSGANAPAFNVGNYSCRKAASGIQLYANSTSSQSYQPAKSYQLNITPSGPFNLGGSGMQTDIFATPSSEIQTSLSAIPAGALGCPVVGTTKGQGCTITLSSFSGSLAQTLAGGGDFPLSALNLTFYYLITHTGSTTNPYNPTEISGNSVTLPNTRISVGNGS